MADSPYFDSTYFDDAYFDVDTTSPPPTLPPGVSIRGAAMKRPRPEPEAIDEDWIVLIL